MELIILGSGTYEPEEDRRASSYLVKTGNQNIVLDFGRGVINQLIRSGVEYIDIDRIFITHTHSDHSSELASLLHISLAEPEFGKKRYKELHIYGPKGLKETIEHIKEAFHIKGFKPKYDIHIHELDDGKTIKGNGWIVKAFRVKHSLDNCLAYRIESEEKSFVYSGDTEYCKGLVEACKDTDLAVIETSWQKGIVSHGHLTAEEVGKIAKESGLKKLVLTHIAPYYLKNYDVEEEAKKFFQGPVVIAKDLMKIKI